MRAALVLIAALLATGCAAGREGWSYRPASADENARAFAFYGPPGTEADFAVVCGRDGRISLDLIGIEEKEAGSARLSAGAISRVERATLEPDGLAVSKIGLSPDDPLIGEWVRTGRLSFAYEDGPLFLIAARGAVGRVLRTCRRA